MTWWLCDLCVFDRSRAVNVRRRFRLWLWRACCIWSDTCTWFCSTRIFTWRRETRGSAPSAIGWYRWRHTHTNIRVNDFLGIHVSFMKCVFVFLIFSHMCLWFVTCLRLLALFAPLTFIHTHANGTDGKHKPVPRYFTADQSSGLVNSRHESAWDQRMIKTTQCDLSKSFAALSEWILHV